MDNTKANGLLYPAMHKFYSALSSLEQFQKGSNFFDNTYFLDEMRKKLNQRMERDDEKERKKK